MVVLIVAALFGSFVGLAIRNGFVALFLAAVLTGFLQFVTMVFVEMLAIQPEHMILAQQLQQLIGTQLISPTPNMVAAGAAALLSALIKDQTLKDREAGFWLPDTDQSSPRGVKSKRVRHAALVEDRAVHDDVRTRMNKLLRR